MQIFMTPDFGVATFGKGSWTYCPWLKGWVAFSTGTPACHMQSSFGMNFQQAALIQMRILKCCSMIEIQVRMSYAHKHGSTIVWPF